MLDQLARDDLQSDQRFAESYVRSRYLRCFGAIKITAELRARGIEDQLIETSLSAYSREDWLAALGRDLRGNRISNLKEKARLVRRYRNKGFALSLVFEAMDNDDQP